MVPASKTRNLLRAPERLPLARISHCGGPRLLPGEVFLATGNHDEAITLLETALSQYEEPAGTANFEVAVRLALAEAYAATCIRRFADAHTVLDWILRSHPYDDRAHALRARVFVREGRVQDAYWSAVAAVKANPRSLEAACYASVIGFLWAEAEGSTSEMEANIRNLRVAQQYCPGVDERIDALIERLQTRVEQSPKHNEENP